LASLENSTLTNLELSSIFVRQAPFAFGETLFFETGEVRKLLAAPPMFTGVFTSAKIGAGFYLYIYLILIQQWRI